MTVPVLEGMRLAHRILERLTLIHSIKVGINLAQSLRVSGLVYVILGPLVRPIGYDFVATLVVD